MTSALRAILDAIAPMRNNRLQNYIVPGLTSYLIGDGDKFGRVRLFSIDRQSRDFITPHSHRFDFTCLVLEGRAHNGVFQPHGVDQWCLSKIDQVCGKKGLREYTHTRDIAPSHWTEEVTSYGPGCTYSMDADQIHSIRFDRGTQVLFFEGPQLTKQSLMLEPWVDGKVVPTFKTESWMFDTETTI